MIFQMAMIAGDKWTNYRVKLIETVQAEDAVAACRFTISNHKIKCEDKWRICTVEKLK